MKKDVKSNFGGHFLAASHEVAIMANILATTVQMNLLLPALGMMKKDVKSKVVVMKLLLWQTF